MPSFDNTEIAFKGKSDQQLQWSYLLFKMIGKPWLVRTGAKLSRMAFKLKIPVRRFIKKTIFRQFCGGETIKECSNKINELSNFGICSILDYSVEGSNSKIDLDKTENEIIETLKKASEEKSKIPFGVFKPSGICRMEILEKLNIPNYHFTIEEETEADEYYDRMKRICSAAEKYNVSIFIDAEDSWIQDGIDKYAEEMMMTYNKSNVIVFTTLQMYRKDRLKYLKELYQKALTNNFKVGIKLVRGAYMEKERERAKELEYESPIQLTKEDTDNDFNLALEFIFEHLDTFSLCCGTHNEKSNDLMLQLIEKYKISRHDKRIFSAQLLGMSDHITFNLAHNGYNVLKYVPYGPVKEVMPYLIRRAQENTSIAGQTGRELSLIRKEKERRKLFPVLVK